MFINLLPANFTYNSYDKEHQQQNKKKIYEQTHDNFNVAIVAYDYFVNYFRVYFFITTYNAVNIKEKQCALPTT